MAEREKSVVSPNIRAEIRSDIPVPPEVPKLRVLGLSSLQVGESLWTDQICSTCLYINVLKDRKKGTYQVAVDGGGIRVWRVS